MIKITKCVEPGEMDMIMVIEGMRNPMNSWEKSDSVYDGHDVGLGINDKGLMLKLAKAGTEHRKYLRMMNIYLRITAPLYWWKEFDTYKVGTVTNSCSTMHKIAEKSFTIDDFSCEHLLDCESVSKDEFYEFDCGRRYTPMDSLNDTIKMLNKWRWIYLNRGKTKSAWWQMIQLLPSCYNQTRNVMLNYEVLANIYRQRKNHKLDEWRKFGEFIENIRYFDLIKAAVEKEEPKETYIKWLPIADFYNKWAAGIYNDKTPVVIKRKTSYLKDEIRLYPITAVFKGLHEGWTDWNNPNCAIDETRIAGYFDPMELK